VGHDVELILMKQLASYLAVPIFLVDPAGTLLYYNEPAESLLGRRYDETGEMPMDEWGTVFTPTDREGAPLGLEQLPLAIAVQDGHPTHGQISIIGLDGVARQLSITAFPLVGHSNRNLGAVAIFWEGE
jgi:PAS domain-containing protein